MLVMLLEANLIKIEYLDSNKAIVLLDKVIELDENNYVALTNLGRIYLHLLKPAKAEKFLSKSMCIKSSQPVAVWYLSILQCINHDTHTGYKLISKSIKDKSLMNQGWHVLLYTVQACISYYHVKEKKAFDEYYNKYKMISAVGNSVTLDDIDNELSDDEEVYDSDEEIYTGHVGEDINK